MPIKTTMKNIAGVSHLLLQSRKYICSGSGFRFSGQIVTVTAISYVRDPLYSLTLCLSWKGQREKKWSGLSRKSCQWTWVHNSAWIFFFITYLIISLWSSIYFILNIYSKIYSFFSFLWPKSICFCKHVMFGRLHSIWFGRLSKYPAFKKKIISLSTWTVSITSNCWQATTRNWHQEWTVSTE